MQEMLHFHFCIAHSATKVNVAFAHSSTKAFVLQLKRKFLHFILLREELFFYSWCVKLCLFAFCLALVHSATKAFAMCRKKLLRFFPPALRTRRGKFFVYTRKCCILFFAHPGMKTFFDAQKELLHFWLAHCLFCLRRKWCTVLSVLLAAKAFLDVGLHMIACVSTWGLSREKRLEYNIHCATTKNERKIRFEKKIWSSFYGTQQKQNLHKTYIKIAPPSTLDAEMLVKKVRVLRAWVITEHVFSPQQNQPKGPDSVKDISSHAMRRWLSREKGSLPTVLALWFPAFVMRALLLCSSGVIKIQENPA